LVTLIDRSGKPARIDYGPLPMETATKPQDDTPLTRPAKEPSPMYRMAMAVCRPPSIWGRLRVEGLEVLPESGPALVVGNHDSHWDPVTVGVAAIRRRQIKALAKSDLWKVRGLAPVLNGMGQIPIERGAGDVGALARAIEELQRGACIGVFPEGTRSRGKVLRARSGVGRLALEVPEAKIVCVAIEGTTGYAKFPSRPRVSTRFFEPAGGQVQPGEEPGELAARLLAEIRQLVPPSSAGRKRS
jgi:1-acyl-sn-glycerol-3-phosphate acyltransferase